MPKEKKTIFYSDLLNDDFAENNIDCKPLKDGFVYIHKNIFWKISAFFIYYFIAMPILFVYGKLHSGVKVKNRKAIKKLKHKGYFLYGNHTQNLDAFSGHVFVSRPKKCYVVAGPDAMSIKGIGWLIMMLGTLPLPTSIEGTRDFMSAMEKRLAEKKCIVIYPEAHIWPYYNDVRPFSNASFRYPVKYDVPIVAMCTTYKKRKFHGETRRPKIIITLSEPFYPNPNLPLKQAMQDLRDKTYNFMKKTIEENKSYAHINYVYKNKENSEA